MGLDNIPKSYPCVTNGTEVRRPIINHLGEPLPEDPDDPGPIDCKATQEAGGCPWLEAATKADMLEGRVYGIFGTDCWYRGKYGEGILRSLGLEEAYTFYGDSDDGTMKSADSCRLTAEGIIEASDMTNPDERYAAWWLNWVADEADGCVCWY